MRGLASAAPRRAVKELIGDDEETGRRGRGIRSVGPHEILDAAEIGRLLVHADPGLYRTLFATVAGAGLRPEEVCALQWGDVQFDDTTGRGKIFVRRSLSWSPAQGESGRIRPKFYDPKTKSGTRSIPLSPRLATALKTWKMQSPRSENDLVFCREDGQPLHRSSVLRQGLYPALRRAKLRRVNVKSLRHSFASMLIAKGAAITEVQHLMGHSDPSVTLRVYSHWFKDADSGSIDSVAADIFVALADAAPVAIKPSGRQDGYQMDTETASAVANAS